MTRFLRSPTSRPQDPARRHRGPRAVPSLMASSEPDQSDDLPDPASAYPATIIVDGNVYDVLPAGRPVNVKGPWPKGWRTMAQRKNETAQEFAARCEKAIEVERVCAPRPKSA